MPELPEVETLCRQLHYEMVGWTIRSTKVFDLKLAGLPTLRGSKVLGVQRQGKTIVIKLHDGNEIRVHLRMTGRLLLFTPREKSKHTRLRIYSDQGHIDLVDPRRFATVSVSRQTTPDDSRDLFGRFDRRTFLEKQTKRRVCVKAVLMDPKAIDGIGNIYASEILYGAGVSPERAAGSLEPSEWQRVMSTARRILKKAIQSRGTSISDWQDLYGKPGENQHALRVYGQNGKCCERCGATIARIRQGGRSTYYCPGCQI